MTDLQKDGSVCKTSENIIQNTPSRVSEIQIGDTLFTVISVQSNNARESAYDKVRKLILNHAADITENVSESSRI